MTLLLEAKMSDQKMPKRPMSPRQKRYWLTTGGLGLVGGIFGYVMPAGKSDPSYVLLSNMPLSASLPDLEHRGRCRLLLLSSLYR
jgi:hypothetical protein